MADDKKEKESGFKVIEEGIDLVFNFGKRVVTDGLKEVFEINTGDPAKDKAEIEDKMKELKRKAKARMQSFVDGLWEDTDEPFDPAQGDKNKKDKVDP
jgi:hypothetical protein